MEVVTDGPVVLDDGVCDFCHRAELASVDSVVLARFLDAESAA